MSFPFADIHREINGLMFERPSDVSIKVDNLDRFVGALSKDVDLVPAEKPIKGAEFCGVKVVANDMVPEGMAVIMHGKEIVNIIRYAS
ncbi:hypothetical protein ABCW43_00165 [Neorhizobium sp. IRAMC:178]|uniref:hypothetical protein n=1 Tax=Neorhizobium tunisiense TaxID=3144793 RepID=UPI0031F65CBE